MEKIGEYKDFWQFKYTYWTKRDRVEVFRLKNGDLRVFEDLEIYSEVVGLVLRGRRAQDFITGNFVHLVFGNIDPKTGMIDREFHRNKESDIITNRLFWKLGKRPRKRNLTKQIQANQTFLTF